MRNTIIRRTGVAAAALTLAFGLAACGSDDDSNGNENTTGSNSQAPDESGMSETDENMQGAGADTFGPGCSAIPTSGDGSFDGMATEPVATAASANPLLTTLVAAVTEAGLVDTLNSADGITVFAPTDDAFAKIPEADLQGVLADKELLTTILTHHVVGGQLGPDQIAGEHETLAGDMIEVKGSGEEFTVGDEDAAVLCGNIPTANATVYVIDTVLMP
ncbi:fasciclin domain-containing protein [Nocardioides sp. AE5]|uniref:fasciclin domain-containing protein n=1 Tax=Nocardioides sp. AE5 TaxID=2962573 RepID=UPI002880F0A2|nr:fasciclin domain-containing protein [Nocardioides sp. AE5]MDT0200437.1 fasciclin domain-containing protein [Nocardioides sp. AE5]